MGVELKMEVGLESFQGLFYSGFCEGFESGLYTHPPLPLVYYYNVE